MSKYLKTSTCIFCILYILGCKNAKKSEADSEKDIVWKVKESKKIIDTTLHFVTTTKTIEQFNYSGNGNVFFQDSNIIVHDNLFGITTILSTRGKIIKQFGGLDTSENHHNTWTLPYSITKYSNGYASIFQRSIAYLDSTFGITTIKNIKFRGKENLTSILDIPSPNNMTAYELNERAKNYCQISESEIVVSVESEAPSFNPYNSLEYFKKARSFGLVNLKKGSLSAIPITRSSVYKDTCCLSVQDGSFFVKKDSTFYIQFAADSLIYVYNQKYIPLYAYGVSGNFNPNRIYNNGLEIAFDDEKYKQLEEQANVIESLFLFEKDMIGRIANNRSTKKKYLQVFKDADLINETEIPADFNFIGVMNSSIIGILKGKENHLKLCIIK